MICLSQARPKKPPFCICWANDAKILRSKDVQCNSEESLKFLFKFDIALLQMKMVDDRLR